MHFPQKVYKLTKAKFSRFEGTRGDKNQIFRTLFSNDPKNKRHICPLNSVLGRTESVKYFVHYLEDKRAR